MKTKEELIFQALGAASMCWTGAPSGTFDINRCKQIGDELIAALENAEALKPSHNSASLLCDDCIHSHGNYCLLGVNHCIRAAEDFYTRKA